VNGVSVDAAINFYKQISCEELVMQRYPYVPTPSDADFREKAIRGLEYEKDSPEKSE
jgi:hypothetical protein